MADREKRLPKDSLRRVFPLCAADVLEAASYSLECTVYSVVARNRHVYQVSINIHDELKKKTHCIHIHILFFFRFKYSLLIVNTVHVWVDNIQLLFKRRFFFFFPGKL